MFTIERVGTKDSRFTEVMNRFSKALNEFVEYSDYRSQISGKVKRSSNKASSYRNYLVRIIIAYEENNNIKIEDIHTLDTFYKINNIRNIPGFKEFNRASSNFYSAALAEYERFLKQKQEILEIEMDSIINEEVINMENERISFNYSSLIKKPQLRKEKTKYKSNYLTPRSHTEAFYAKERANWKCELDKEHDTFKTKAGKPYVEVHHLIPMSFQDEYKYTIDFADNIVALCPNCHRLLHHERNGKEKLTPIKHDLDEKLGVDTISYDEIKQYIIEVYSNK